MPEHDGGHVFIVVFCLAALVMTGYLHFAAVEAYRTTMLTPSGWFSRDAVAQRVVYEHVASPDPRIYWMWVGILFWLLLWLVWYLTTMCRTTMGEKKYIYNQGSMSVISPTLVFLALGGHVGQIFCLDLDIQIAVTVLWFVVSVLSFVAVEMSYQSMVKHGWELIVDEKEGDVAASRGLLHNGVAFYATWAYVLAVANAGSTLIAQSVLGEEDAATATLGALGFFVFVYGAVDLTPTSDKKMRFTFTPYFAVILAVVSMIVKYTTAWTWDRIHIMLVALGGLTFIFLIVKIALVAKRTQEKEEPLEPDDGVVLMDTPAQVMVEAPVIVEPLVVETPAEAQYPGYPYYSQPAAAPSQASPDTIASIYQYYSQFADRAETS